MIRSAADLLEELRAVDESSTIEAKAGSGIDRSVLETLCAFANEPGMGGGHLLLGVRVSPQLDLLAPSYEVVGVPDPDQLQSDLASRCATNFNLPLRPQIRVEILEGKPVLVAFVQELSPTEKPLFLQSLGLPRGAFRRVGSTDQEGTDDDLIALYEGHQTDTFDGGAVRDATLADLDPDAIRVYRELRQAANAAAEELTWLDDDLLRALSAIGLENGVWRPTVAGLLLFGTAMALRRCFPMMRIDYVRIPGREWVENPDRRFDTIEIRAPLLIAARKAIAAVRDDLPSSFRLPEGEVIRTDETILPIRVLREAIVNAVMHRSYRIHGPIQILRYANRLEIRNPGHSLKAEEQLGEPGSQTRNPRIAAVLHEVHLAETKGSGIRAMRELMLQHDLLPPTFESSRRPDHFVATFLFHHFLGEGDLQWLRSLTVERVSDEDARALIFVREAGAIDNAAYRALNRTDTLSASGHLRRLRDLGLLVMKGAGNRTYYVAGPAFAAAPTGMPVPQSSPRLAVVPPDAGRAGDLPLSDAAAPQGNDSVRQIASPQPPATATQPPEESTQPPAESPQPSEESTQPLLVVGAAAPPELPRDLADRIRNAGLKPRRSSMRELVLLLCAWRPLSVRELAGLLGGRDPRELARTHLRPMVAAGDLVFTIPEMPNHPDQKYTVPSNASE